MDRQCKNDYFAFIQAHFKQPDVFCVCIKKAHTSQRIAYNTQKDNMNRPHHMECGVNMTSHIDVNVKVRNYPTMSMSVFLLPALNKGL